MKRVVFLVAALCLVGCQPPSQASTALINAASGEGVHAGTLTGKTSKGEPCSLEILSHSEKRHVDIDPTGDQEYTNLEKTLEIRTSFQQDRATVIIVKSYFNRMWDAFETNYLAGRYALGQDRTELAKVYLNHKGQVAAMDYYRDPTHVIMGVTLGEVQESCFFLR